VKIILGVSASVAIYKAAEICRFLEKEGADVTVVMTPNATRLVDPRLFDAVTSRHTITDLFDRDQTFAHLAVAREARAFAVAPATANVLGKLAAGLADDALTTVALTVSCPRLVAPAMNPAMWDKVEVQKNVAALRGAGYTVIPPEAGLVACGDTGVGRLAAPAVIVEEILCAAAEKGPLAGKRVVVTAGPTREPFDAVRVLTNPSSGLMGHEIARRAARRGARVTLITGARPAPAYGAGVAVVPVDTAAGMLEATREAFRDADALIMAAAVSDYAPARVSAGKLKKNEAELKVNLVPTTDIIAELAKNKGRKVVVGFAAEVDNMIEHGKAKLLNKQCDIVVANIIGRTDVGFGADCAEAAIITAGGVRELGRIAKTALADAVLDELGERLAG